MIHRVVPSMIGFALAPAIAIVIGLFLARKYGGQSQERRRAIAVGTIVLAAVLTIAWGLYRGGTV